MALALLLLPFLAAQAQAQPVPAPGHWPQWRGPNRDNVSTETGLLKEWPEGGPKLLWKATGAGDGGGPVAVAGGLIFVLGAKEDKYCITALDGAGKLVWERPIGAKTGEYALMRYLGQCCVTVDDDRVYACTAQGRLLCMAAGNGKTLWEKDFVKDLGGQKDYFTYRENSLVDDKLLICAPGGPKGTLAALEKKTGKGVWRSEALKDPMPQTAVVAAELGGVRQYVVLTMKSVAGVAAANGNLLWRTDFDGRTQVASTPIVHDGVVLVTSGYEVGWHAFQVSKTGAAFQASELYAGKQAGTHRSATRVGDRVYAADGTLRCFDLKTGNAVWAKGTGYGAILATEGFLIVQHEYRPGLLALFEITPDEPRERGTIQLPEGSTEGATNQAVLAGGRLYVRDIDVIYCYDLRGPEYKEPPPVWRIAVTAPAPRPAPLKAEKATDAAFVPTPQDVVERMIALAKVTKDDVLFDLGSGDGRILIAAAKSQGCRAVGFEIDPELVKLSRYNARVAGVDGRVTIEEKDLFTADLGPATVVTLYLGAPNNAKLLPRLRALKPGVRIVSHQHLLGDAGPKPDEMVKLTSKDDPGEHTLYLWTTPLK